MITSEHAAACTVSPFVARLRAAPRWSTEFAWMRRAQLSVCSRCAQCRNRAGIRAGTWQDICVTALDHHLDLRCVSQCRMPEREGLGLFGERAVDAGTARGGDPRACGAPTDRAARGEKVDRKTSIRRREGAGLRV